MKINAAHKYEHDVKSVFSVFSDPEFYKEKFSGVGARNVEIVESEVGNEGFRIKTKRDMPADVPGVLSKFVGEWNTIVQTETWQNYGDDEFGSELDIEAEGVPVTITGTMLLRPNGSGCINDVELDIVCNIPFVGKSLAEFVARDSERSLVREYEFIKSYLIKEES